MWTDLDFVLLALEGHNDWWTAILGGGKGKDAAPINQGNKQVLDARGKPLVMTPAIFDAMFDRENPKMPRRKS